MQRTPAFALSALALTGALACGLAQAQTSEPVIGLITKTETNPVFVKMKEGATAEAKKLGAKVVSAAGKTDGDNAGQVTAMENLMAAGAKTILITPSDAKAIVPAIKKAQTKGVMVIALDSPTDPADATDALFATDNYKAGELIGQYAKAALAGKKPVRTMDDMKGLDAFMPSEEAQIAFAERCAAVINKPVAISQGGLIYTVYYAVGDVYTGGFDGQMKQGNGILRLLNGDYYIGQFKDDLLQGYGIFVWEEGDFYEGYWSKDMFNGKGIYTYPNGTYQSGDWVDNALM